MKNIDKTFFNETIKKKIEKYSPINTSIALPESDIKLKPDDSGLLITSSNESSLYNIMDGMTAPKKKIKKKKNSKILKNINKIENINGLNNNKNNKNINNINMNHYNNNESKISKLNINKAPSLRPRFEVYIDDKLLFDYTVNELKFIVQLFTCIFEIKAKVKVKLLSVYGGIGIKSINLCTEHDYQNYILPKKKKQLNIEFIGE